MDTATRGVPTSTVTAGTGNSVRYCVRQYAPNGKVLIRVEQTGTTGSIHTNYHGGGCTNLAVAAACSHGQRIVATGTGADGNPATSSATVGPRAISGCVEANRTSRAAGSGTGPLGGGDTLLLGVAGVLLLGFAAIGVLAVRRRRAAPDT